jgi:hypothetical protein
MAHGTIAPGWAAQSAGRVGASGVGQPQRPSGGSGAQAGSPSQRREPMTRHDQASHRPPSWRHTIGGRHLSVRGPASGE